MCGLDGAGRADRHARGVRLRALRDEGEGRPVPVHSRHPHGAAGVPRHSVLSDLRQGRPARFFYRADRRLHDLQPVVLRVGAPQLLSRSAGGARRGGRARGLVQAADLPPRRIPAAAQRRDRHRGAVLHLRLERVSVRLHAGRQGGADAAGLDPQADHHPGRALGRDGGGRLGGAAAGVRGGTVPAAPHRPRPHPGGGEGLAPGWSAA